MFLELSRGHIAGCECGGLWLNKKACVALAELRLSAAELAFIASADNAATEQTKKSYREASPIRSCPKCGKRLGRSRVKHTMDTVDFCGAHGSFFDAQEAVRLDEALRALVIEDPEPTLLAKLRRLVGL